MADEQEGSEGDFISVVQAVHLIPQNFDGNPKNLRAFIEGADAACQVTRPSKHPLLVKFIESKITGDAKDRLLARTERHTWAQIKQILEENFAVRRTLEYYAGILFTSKQGATETVAQWGSRLDAMAMDLRREVRSRLEILEEQDNEKYTEGGLRLIGEFLKGTFVAGLKDDRIKYIVKAKGEEGSLAQLIETALQEESEVKSQYLKTATGSKWQGTVRQGYPSYKSYREPPGNVTVKREINYISEQGPGNSRGGSYNKNKVCYRCSKQGHMAKGCREALLCGRCGSRDHITRNCKQGNRY